ncbi:MAG: hypothetical protein OEY34_00340 [Cyclobacteriaceae bacterium]|nr:hypothetical protein [Cyclobacteriaceae bacterium]
MDKIIHYSLRLLKLHCYLSDESDADELFIKLDGKKIWPSDKKYYKIKEDSVEIKFETKVEKNSEVVVEFWDYDLFSANDLLGTVKIIADASGGPYTSDMVKKEAGNARYALEWELV